MKEHFRLQLLTLNRRFRDAGIFPPVGYLLCGILFIALSVGVFRKVIYPQFSYPLIGLLCTTALSQAGRNEFLELCFGHRKFRLIRAIENGIVCLPFAAFLIYERSFVACAFPLLAAAGSWVQFRGGFSLVIPTPFYARPFEFAAGFRKTLPAILLAYLLAGVSLVAGNLNLGLVAAAVVFICALTYYALPEPELLVWNYSLSPRRFLFRKFGTAAGYSLLLIAPVAIALLFGFSGSAKPLLLIIAAGIAFLAAMIVAKYAAFPGEIGLVSAIFRGISLLFPPLLLAFIPYFFRKAEQRLKPFLDDRHRQSV